MDKYYQKVKDYILDLGHAIVFESEVDNLIVVENEDIGVKNMVIGIASPIVIIEQYLFDVRDDPEVFKCQVSQRC